jgi:1,4-dihydroxy-2-naphthoate octaprenyltransferase
MIILSYLVGTGLVDYLGREISQQKFWLGLIISILFYVSSELISDYFLSINNITLENRAESLRFRNNLFILFIVTITIIALFTYFLYQDFSSSFLFLIFWTSFLFFMILYSIPPFSLKNRGFGDILLSILITSITPMFAYILQLKDVHTTLFLITFPVFFLLISYFLAQILKEYASDFKNNKNTLMTKLGWKTGMKLHNIFLLTTFVLYGVAAIIGLPARLVMPALFAFPIACIQFWEMWRIGEGYKPRWNLLKISSMGSISVITYFLLFNLWLR